MKIFKRFIAGFFLGMFSYISVIIATTNSIHRMLNHIEKNAVIDFIGSIYGLATFELIFLGLIAIYYAIKGRHSIPDPLDLFAPIFLGEFLVFIGAIIAASAIAASM